MYRRASDKVAYGVQIHQTIKVFGRFRIIDSIGNEIDIANKRARAILVMLCVAKDNTLDREFIASTLWAGRYTAQAKASLRQCLLDLSKLAPKVGGELLVVTRKQVRLNHPFINTDWSLLSTALKQQNAQAITAYLLKMDNQVLLDQFHVGDAFAQWLAEQQLQIERFIHSAVQSVLAHLQQNANDDDYHLLKAAWQPREPVDSGDSKKALSATKFRLAVLPFTSPAAQEHENYLGDAIVDEIITMLGQVPEILVAGRNSSFGLKNTQRSLAEIADILGVSYLLAGSVQRQGDEVRISIRLIDPKDEFEKWANRYKGNINNIFQLQEQVSVEVTHELSKVLGVVLRAPKIHQMTSSQVAYDLYMQGRALSKRIVGEGVLTTAITLFEQALEIDPYFAQCWSALAEANAYVTVFTPCIDKMPFVHRMAECANKALALTPRNGLAMVMLGAYYWTQNEPLAALDLAFAAHKLEPNNPAVTARVGSFLSYCGLTKQALPFISAAVKQDPLDGRHLIHLSTALLNLGDIAGARQIGEKIAAVGFPSLWLAVATAAAGERELAVKLYSQTRLIMNSLMSLPTGAAPMTEQQLDDYWETISKGVCSGNEQDRQKYCRLLDFMHASLPDKYDSSIVLPSIWLGYAPMLFNTVGQQITPPNMACLMSLWADIEPIRQIRIHPDFMAFASKIGLVSVWQKYGWPDLLPAPAEVNTH